MRAFWTEQPLPAAASLLLREVALAHAASVARPNVSTQVVQAAAFGSGSYTQALAAALSTLGGAHACTEEARKLLEAPDSPAFARLLLQHGRKVPGWGGSFQRNKPDPLWQHVARRLHDDFPALAGRLEAVTAALHQANRPLFPNPAAFTAAAAIASGCPRGCSAFLFVAGRLEAWSRLIQHSLAQHL